MEYMPLSKLYYINNDAFETEYEKRKSSPYAVSLGIKIHGWEAFYTNLPDSAVRISRIYKKFAKLNTLCVTIPQVAYKKYERNCLIDEIIITNDIEGVRSTRKEIMDVLDNEQYPDKKLRFDGLVKKYVRLLDTPDNSFQVSLENSADLRALYDEIVLDEIAHINKPDGMIFRKDLAEVVSGTQQVKHTGVFPESKIIKYVDDALQLFKRGDIPPLYLAAVLHYMIGYIHPFYDGNGRLSRFISSYLLKQEFNALVALRLSYTIKNKKNDYYKAFDISNDTNNRGDLTHFINYFFDVVEASMDSLTEKLEQGNAILESFSALLDKKYAGFDSNEKKKTSDVLWYLIQNDLFSNEPFDKKSLSLLLKSSPGTAHNYVEALIADGAPIETKKEGRKFVYKLDGKKLFEFLQKE